MVVFPNFVKLPGRQQTNIKSQGPAEADVQGLGNFGCLLQAGYSLKFPSVNTNISLAASVTSFFVSTHQFNHIVEAYPCTSRVRLQPYVKLRKLASDLLNVIKVQVLHWLTGLTSLTLRKLCHFGKTKPPPWELWVRSSDNMGLG